MTLCGASHNVTIPAKVRDPAALAAACARLGLAAPVQGTARLFGGAVSGLMVQLPGWQHPVVADPQTGEVRFDNFQGRWGDQKELDRLLQAYAVAVCRLEARKKGYQVSEQQLADGSVQLQIVEGG